MLLFNTGAFSAAVCGPCGETDKPPSCDTLNDTANFPCDVIPSSGVWTVTHFTVGKPAEMSRSAVCSTGPSLVIEQGTSSSLVSGVIITSVWLAASFASIVQLVMFHRLRAHFPIRTRFPGLSLMFGVALAMAHMLLVIPMYADPPCFVQLWALFTGMLLPCVFNMARMWAVFFRFQQSGERLQVSLCGVSVT